MSKTKITWAVNEVARSSSSWTSSTEITVKPRGTYQENIHEFAWFLGVRRFEFVNHDYYVPIEVEDKIYVFCSPEHPLHLRLVDRIWLPNITKVDVIESMSVSLTDTYLNTDVTWSSSGDIIEAVRIDYADDELFGIYMPSYNTFFFPDVSHYQVEELWWEVREVVHKTLKNYGRWDYIRLPQKYTPKKVKVTLGMDPEFEIVDPNGWEVINAANLSLPWVDSELGRDGAGNQVEIRPNPSSKPSQVVREVKRILGKFSENFPRLELSVKGDVYPLGGHIHFGCKPQKKLIELLDHYIGRTLMEFDGDARGHYSGLGHYRSQPHGFEYRTPPSAYLAHPRVTYLILKLAGEIASRWVSGRRIPFADRWLGIRILIGKKYAEELRQLLKAIRLNGIDMNRILKNWKVKREPSQRNPRYDVLFSSDTFPNEVRTELTRIVRRNAKLSVLPISARKNPMVIRFIGLADSRGVVFGISGTSATWRMEHAPLFKRIDDIMGGAITPIYNLEIWLPYAYRVGRLDASTRRKVNRQLSAIIRQAMLNHKETL